MSPDYLELARQTQRFTFTHLADLGGAADCEHARRLSYRRSDLEPQWCDLWYMATQLGADAALLAADPAFGRCTVEKAAAFVDRFWDRADGGGYLARGRPDGRVMLRPDRYDDDQGHFGLMLLEAYEVTGDRRHLDRARRAADFLMRGGVWDATFGGGFWWNTRRGDTIEGKPAQTNGLAVDLFVQLHRVTGHRHYLEWAEKTLAWLDATLFDPAAGLYRWSVHFEDLERRRGQIVANRFFNYDQGIVIEALVSLYRFAKPDALYVRRARALAERLEPIFWHSPEGSFNLEADVEQVMAIYASWLTPSLLALYQIDPDDRWLALARRNVDALNSYLRAPDGGYFLGAAQQGQSWVVDRTRDTVANAGLQRAQAMLGRRAS